MPLKQSKEDIIELATDPAADSSYDITQYSRWLDTSATPSVLKERNASNTAWNTVGASGGGGSSTLATLTDVTLTGLADEDVLRYDTVTSKWVNDNLTGFGGGPFGGPQLVRGTISVTIATTANEWSGTLTNGNVTTGSNITLTVNMNGVDGTIIATMTGKAAGSFTWKAESFQDLSSGSFQIDYHIGS